MKKIFFLMLVSLLGGMVCAERNLPGVTIVSRAERGANETRKYESRPEYQSIIAKNEERQQHIEELEELGNSTELAKIRAEQEKVSIANDYLVEHFQDEFSIDHKEETENGEELWRTKSYKNEKLKIIIHHTAASVDKNADMRSIIQGIYKFHAFTRGWGDIGYNFLIDPNGVIYEGRAGGNDVVGAHTLYNNSSSVGISVLGNFQNDQPTKAQIESITKLATALAKKYNINPLQKVTYHKKSSTNPYIQNVDNFTIVGHTDAGLTSCPGANLYIHLPAIRKKVLDNLSVALIDARLPADFQQYEKYENILINNILTIPGSEYTVTVPISGDLQVEQCFSLSDSINVKCRYENGKLMINTSYQKLFASGKKRFFIVDKNGKNIFLHANMIRQRDLDLSLLQRENAYKSTKNISFSPTSTSKIADNIDITSATNLLNKPVSVLLYELSTDYEMYEFQCDGGCTINTPQGNMQRISTIYINKSTDTLSINLNDLVPLSGSFFEVESSDGGLVSIMNYTRTNSSIPRNTFRGKISIKKQPIKLLNGTITTQYVLVNTLPFDDYMRGIGEISNNDHPEKHKAMALLAKGYALYYMSGKNPHPSIPTGAIYNAVDDARIFQKYVGAGREKTSKPRKSALDSTKNLILTHNGTLPILPYFSCSAGFTRSAQEKRGWTDTPYLQAKLDVAKCDDFNGHGIGLSGKGAQELASRGFSFKDILNYYYQGLTLSSF